MLYHSTNSTLKQNDIFNHNFYVNVSSNLLQYTIFAVFLVIGVMSSLKIYLTTAKSPLHKEIYCHYSTTINQYITFILFLSIKSGSSLERRVLFIWMHKIEKNAEIRVKLSFGKQYLNYMLLVVELKLINNTNITVRVKSRKWNKRKRLIVDTISENI